MNIYHSYKRIAARGVTAWIGALSLYGWFAVQTASAASGAAGFRDLVMKIIHYISSRVFPILVGLAVLAFFFNIIFFIGSVNNPTEKEKFRKYTVNAILGLFIMLAVWGIVGILTQTVFQTNPFIPQLQTSD